MEILDDMIYNVKLQNEKSSAIMFGKGLHHYLLKVAFLAFQNKKLNLSPWQLSRADLHPVQQT